jgi:molecular chaperone DnaK
VTVLLGIDLGTTNSCVAVARGGGPPAVLAAPGGERTTPSMVCFHPDGRVLVGHAARRHAVTQARRTVFGSKRLIGRKVTAPDVALLARFAPFEIVAAANGDAWVRLEHRDVSPQEVSAYLLEHMRRIAEESLGEPVTQAVITVPAYFDDVQRQATRDAGRIAGLDVRRIINEPTAAALAHGAHRRKGRHRLVVFDLGGGTFDVSVLDVDRGMFEVLAVNGDAALGGDDFDRRIVERLLEELAAAGAVDPGGDAVTLGRLLEEAERVKRVLSDETEARVELPFAGRAATGEPVHLRRVLRRDELEALCADLVARLEPPCAAALRDAGLAPGDVDDVLLVGGMTRAPAVMAAVERIFRRKPSRGANPDEAVALGAAAHGALLASERDDLVLLDVIPQSLGVRVGDAMAVVIPRNTTVPARGRKLFATTRADQTEVTVEIYQGEAREARENRHLGRFTLDGLPPGPPGSVRVEVAFRVDADGIVSLEAREISTGRAAHLVLSPSGGLSDDDMRRIIAAHRDGA